MCAVGKNLIEEAKKVTSLSLVTFERFDFLLEICETYAAETVTDFFFLRVPGFKSIFVLTNLC